MKEGGGPTWTGPQARIDRLLRFGNRTAYHWREGVRWRSRSYASLHARIRSCAAMLAREGMSRGDRVLIQGPPHPAWVEALFGVFLAGGVAVPLDDSSGDAFRSEVVRRTGSRLLMAPQEIAAPAGCRRIDWDRLGEGEPPPSAAFPPVTDGEGAAEIVFTSGTTGEPRGVVLTHANIASDFASIEQGFRRREGLVRHLGTLPFLTTLPLSHMFGQALGIYLPLYMGLTVVLVPPRPRDAIEAARRFRAWGLFTVPRLLDLLALEVRKTLRDEGGLERTMRRQERLSRLPFYLQALLFGRVRRIFGARFRLLVAGGAPLPQAVQQFWERFGFLVVQGYGLTETAPIVSISNPFRRASGSVGRPLGIQEVTLGPGNEVLVRGPNVTPGYFGAGDSPDAPGWFRTGDIGEFDAEGQLRIRGRLKDMIVTPEGENVYPEDVEAALARAPGLREACVLGLQESGAERVHAVLLLEPGADPEKVVRSANEHLQPRQRIRDYTVWVEEDLPRTSTGKVRKGVVRERIASDRGNASSPGAGSSTLPGDVRRLVARVGRSRPERIDAQTRLVETLGMVSLDLVELAVALEEEFGVVLSDESLSSATVGDLEKAVREAAGARPAAPRGPAESTAAARIGEGEPPPAVLHPLPRSPGALRMPRWARRAPTHLLRRLLEEGLYRPLVLSYARPQVTGLEHLRQAAPPFLFVCNHRSFLDSGLFKTALPFHLRGRIAPAMTTRHHRAYFGEATGRPLRYGVEWMQVRLVELLFGAWPLPETAAFRQSLAYAGELMEAGISLLIFPEGRHVPEGTMEPFRPGIGIFARELRAPVIPARVEGTARVLPDSARWLRFHRTRLALGAPMFVDPAADPSETAQRLEAAVRGLVPRSSGG
jgi:long-chain acyl-CoA synthetase